MRDIFYMLGVAAAVAKNLCKILEDCLGNLSIPMTVHPDFIRKIYIFRWLPMTVRKSMKDIYQSARSKVRL